MSDATLDLDTALESDGEEGAWFIMPKEEKPMSLWEEIATIAARISELDAEREELRARSSEACKKLFAENGEKSVITDPRGRVFTIVNREGNYFLRTGKPTGRPRKNPPKP